MFQARYQAQLVEDHSYGWTLSRYVHRNPYPLLTEHPALYPWSTYGGYVGTAARVPWVAYDELLRHWKGEFGGMDALAAYRQFVEQDLDQRVRSPFLNAIDGWILGSTQFADQVRKLISAGNHEPTVALQRRVAPFTLEQLIKITCAYYNISAEELSRCGSRHPARPALAVLARKHSAATLSDMALVFGLARRDCVPNLFRRAERDPQIQEDLTSLEDRLDQSKYSRHS